jgi:hypothetical protein
VPTHVLRVDRIDGWPHRLRSRKGEPDRTPPTGQLTVNTNFPLRLRETVPAHSLSEVAMVVLWSYYWSMSTVVKRSVSLPAELFKRLEHEAAEDGRTMSATLAEAADLWLSTRKGLKAVRAWEREHGALTADELAEADAALDRAGVGLR